MSSLQSIPADQFLDEAIRALTFMDASALQRLEALAPAVVLPIDKARYRNQRAVYAALLHATARNFRLLHRAASRHDGEPLPLRMNLPRGTRGQTEADLSEGAN